MIPVFYDYQKEFELLNKFLNNQIPNNLQQSIGGLAEKNSQAQKVIAQLKLNEKVVFIDLAASNAREAFAGLQMGQIGLVSVGQLPQPVFEALYIGSESTLVYFCEGESTRNLIIAASPKPFIKMGFNPREEKQFNPASERDAIKRGEAYRDFIIASQQKNSNVTKHFKTQHEKAQQPSNDRFTIGLNSVAEELHEMKIKVSSSLHNLFNKVKNQVGNVTMTKNERPYNFSD